MRYDPDIHHRRSIRLKGYDYSQSGAYFLTICTQNRECLFGGIENGSVCLNGYGKIASETWDWLSKRYYYLQLEKWVIMPNHLHGIIKINNAACRGGSRTAPTPTIKPLGRIIGAYKTVSTKQINQIRNTPGISVWQRNYYEHIIRNDDEYKRITDYIMNNPKTWEKDM